MPDIKEEYKQIIGYSYYYVSNKGNILSTFTGRLLPIKLNKSKGYLNFTGSKLTSEGKRKKTTIFVHREVARCFLGTKPKNREVRHLDGNKLNNEITNLKYGTKKQNQRDRLLHGTHNRGSRCGKAKLNESQVLEIVKLKKESEVSNNYLASMFKVNHRTISNILSKNAPEWKWLVGGLI